MYNIYLHKYNAYIYLYIIYIFIYIYILYFYIIYERLDCHDCDLIETHFYKKSVYMLVLDSLKIEKLRTAKKTMLLLSIDKKPLSTMFLEF